MSNLVLLFYDSVGSGSCCAVPRGAGAQHDIEGMEPRSDDPGLPDVGAKRRAGEQSLGLGPGFLAREQEQGDAVIACQLFEVMVHRGKKGRLGCPAADDEVEYEACSVMLNWAPKGGLARRLFPGEVPRSLLSSSRSLKMKPKPPLLLTTAPHPSFSPPSTFSMTPGSPTLSAATTFEAGNGSRKGRVCICRGRAHARVGDADLLAGCRRGGEGRDEEGTERKEERVRPVDLFQYRLVCAHAEINTNLTQHSPAANSGKGHSPQHVMQPLRFTDSRVRRNP